MQDSVSMDVLYYQRHPERGWQFKAEAPGCSPDTVNGGIQFIQELYEKQNSKEKTVSFALALTLIHTRLQTYAATGLLQLPQSRTTVYLAC